MPTGRPAPGGVRNTRPGGSRQLAPGGVSYAGEGNWRVLGGHVEADALGPLNTSGPRTAVTRGVRNVRRDAKTTSVTYAWTLPTVPGGSTTAVGSITGGSTQTASFTPDVAGTYVFRCVVTWVRSGGNATKTFNFNYTSA